MEAPGALKIVKRALDKNSLRYVSYIGDAYISSFNEVNNSKSYNDFKIIKKRNMLGMCRSVLTGDKTYKDHITLVIAIKKEAEPIFRDFSSEALLLKFFNGLT